MFLKHLTLTNFRNYATLDFEFKKKITVLIGDNAQGKSNFLEAVFFLATTKSTKAQREDELIKSGETVLRVEGLLDDETNLEIAVQSVEGSLAKRVKVNGVNRRVSDYSVNLSVVLFAPEDINLVNGSPSSRRNYLDLTLSQIDKHYKKALSNYENVVTRKNKLLKSIREGSAKINELDFWTDSQLEFARVLINKRVEFFEFINRTEKKFGDFEFHYQPSTINHELLTSYQRKEIDAATSLIGPHRDDFIFKLNGQDLAKFGSRGEQRTSVLDLKLAEVEYVENSLGNRPILLLDDIFSELDALHRNHVIDLSKLQQTIIATVEWDDYLKEKLKGFSLFYVENGQLSSKAYK